MSDLNARVESLLLGLDNYRGGTSSDTVASDVSGEAWTSTLELHSPLSPRGHREHSTERLSKSVSWASDLDRRPRMPSLEEDRPLNVGQSPLRELLDREVARMLSSSGGVLSRSILDDMVHHADQLWREREGTAPLRPQTTSGGVASSCWTVHHTSARGSSRRGCVHLC